jgi:hypothetical protein
VSRILHLDPQAGAAGDMLLGLLVDLGAPRDLLVALPERLRLGGVVVEVGRTRRGGLDAGRVEVVVRGSTEPPGEQAAPPPAGGTSRRLAEVLAIIGRADLPPAAARRAERAFRLLFEAEGRVHGRAVDQVHLHEAAADDALVDVAGACLLLDALAVDEITCATPVPLGGGTVRCAHGPLSVPVPAVVHLLEGIDVTGGPVPRELVTPTGAALLRALVDRFGPVPALRLERAGAGAGTREDPELPNVLRGLLGTATDAVRARTVTVLETAVDDMLPQDVPVVIDRLLAAGARDALVLPAQMKKGRPGFRFEVVADPDRAEELAELLLRETPTLGVRLSEQRRREWDRDTLSVDTPWGAVRVKRARDTRGRALRGRAEFEDCRSVADAAGVPVDRVRRAAEGAGELEDDES